MIKLLGEQLADGLGYATVSASVGMSLLEWFTAVNVSEALHILASVGGLGFLWYKIRHLRIEVKMRKEELKQLKQKNEKV